VNKKLSQRAPGTKARQEEIVPDRFVSPCAK
jgi:hypothetical protein